MNISDLVVKTSTIQKKFGISSVDMYVLGVLDVLWRDEKEVRVTDVTKKYAKYAGSPATLHKSLTKDLVKAKLVKLVNSDEDARVKYVVRGVKFDDVERMLNE